MLGNEIVWVIYALSLISWDIWTTIGYLKIQTEKRKRIIIKRTVLQENGRNVQSWSFIK